RADYKTSEKAASLIKFDKILGLKVDKAKEFVDKVKSFDIPDSIKEMVKEREKLRKQKKYHVADQMRNKIKKLGFDVRDTKKGMEIVRLDSV
ncbi:hypothetical protein KKG52_01175, partial [Patescibacteria group bacterium]|nr:hypothetical protein [Patescibacteria group bacterium]